MTMSLAIILIIALVVVFKLSKEALFIYIFLFGCWLLDSYLMMFSLGKTRIAIIRNYMSNLCSVMKWSFGQ